MDNEYPDHPEYPLSSIHRCVTFYSPGRGLPDVPRGTTRNSHLLATCLGTTEIEAGIGTERHSTPHLLDRPRIHSATLEQVSGMHGKGHETRFNHTSNEFPPSRQAPPGRDGLTLLSAYLQQKFGVGES